MHAYFGTKSPEQQQDWHRACTFAHPLRVSASGRKKDMAARIRLTKKPARTTDIHTRKDDRFLFLNLG